MQPTSPKNLLSFLGAEHENELVSIYKHVKELDIFSHIDGLFQAPIEHIDISNDQRSIAQLYLFVHYHLYTTMSNLLRMHVAEALSCERKAIEAALSAYEMMVNPSSAAQYEARDWKFLTIKSHIKQAREKDQTQYPLADDLLDTWDFCSEFGAHADSSTFALRLDQVPIPESPDKQKLYFYYFQQPQNEIESRFYYADTFVNFLAILKIFESFIKEHAKGLPFDAWVNKCRRIDSVARNKWVRLKELLETEEEIPSGAGAEQEGKNSETHIVQSGAFYQESGTDHDLE